MQTFLSPNSILAATSFGPTIVSAGAPAPPGQFGSVTLPANEPVLPAPDGQPVAFSFQNAVAGDLKGGVVNAILGVDEPLSYVGEEKAGDADDHAYFTVGNITWGPSWSQFDITYIVKGKNGNGYPETRRYLVNDTSCDVRRRLEVIDRVGVEIIREKGSQLFQTHTKRVIFQGASGQYTAYFKFTPTSRMESLARELLRKFRIGSPDMLYSTTPNAFWMRAVQGNTFYSLISRSGRDFLDYLAGRYCGDTMEVLEFIGRLSMAMFLLGNSDSHQENVLLCNDGDCSALDFETVGMPDMMRWDSIGVEESYFENGYKTGAAYLFGGGDERFRYPDSIRGCVSRIYDGSAEMYRSLFGTQGRSLDWIPAYEGPIYPRMLLQHSLFYPMALQVTPIPHYTFAVHGENFSAMLRRRAELAKRALRMK